jgi:hypothetical protein
MYSWGIMPFGQYSRGYKGLIAQRNLKSTSRLVFIFALSLSMLFLIPFIIAVIGIGTHSAHNPGPTNINPHRPNPDLILYSVNVIGGDIVISGANWSASFQPQFYLTTDVLLDWSQIPANVQKRLWKRQISPTKWKYGVDFSNITDSQKSLLQNVVLHRVASENLTFADIHLQGGCINIEKPLYYQGSSINQPNVSLCHDDILRTYSIPIINKTDVVIGNLDNNWTVCDQWVYVQGNGHTCTQNHTEANWIYDVATDTWNISFDPIIEIDADDTVTDADLSDTIAEGNCTHLNMSQSGFWVNLTGYWNFDCDLENTKLTTHYDFTENDRDVTAFGNVVVNSSDCISDFGNCVQLNGSGDRVVLPSMNLENEVTVSMWIYPKDLTKNSRLFGAHTGSGSQFSSWVYTSGQVAVNWEGGVGGETWATSTAGDIVGGNWYHIVAVRTPADEIEMYINGVDSKDNSGGSGTPPTGSYVYRLGVANAAGAAAFNGTFDEVMFFNDSLTQAEVLEIYLNQSARFKETGTFNYANQSVIGNYSTGWDRVNVSTEMQNLSASAIGLVVGYYNGSWFSTPEQNVTNSTNYTFTVDDSTTNLTLNYTFYAGNQTTSWYSPLLFPNQIGNIVVTNFTAPYLMPQITILQPWNITYNNNSISFNVTGNRPLDWVNAEISGHNNTNFTNQSGEWNYLNDTLADGTYEAIFWFNDTNGYNSTTSIWFTIDVSKPPRITILQPWNTTYNNNSISFNVTGSEPLDWVNVEISGHNNTNFTNQSGEWNYLNDTLAEGTYEAIFWFNDTNGNMNTTNISFTVDKFPEIIFDPTTASSGTQSDDWILINVTSSHSVSNITTFLDWNNSLVSWWRFDDVNGTGDPTDYMDRNNGSVQGTASQNNSGFFGKGFYFNSDGYIDAGNDASTSFSYMSFSVWIKPAFDETQGIAWPFLFDKTRGNTEAWRVLFDATTDNWRYRLYTTGGAVNCETTGIAWTVGEWHHLAGTYNGTDMVVYWDGDLNGTCAQSGSMTTNSDNLFIGAGGAAPAQFFNGTLDDAMIFNRSLNATEIVALYANQSTRYLERNFTGLLDATFPFTAYVQDRGGNVNSTETRTVSVDKFPNINIFQPWNTTYGNNSISFNITGSKPLDWVNAEISGHNNTNFTNQSGEWNYFNDTLADGTYEAIFWFNNTNGNMNTTSIWFTIDTAGPTITANTPINNSYYNTTAIEFNITSSEAASLCLFDVNETSNTTMDNTSTTGWNFTYSNLKNGTTYNITFWCNDTANNGAHSAPYYFTIDTEYPDIIFDPTTTITGTQIDDWIFINVTASDSANNISTFIDWNNSLISWWRMDDVNQTGKGALVQDYMNRNNGTSIADAAQTDAGYFGKGFEFDGSGDKINMSSNYMVDNLSQITVSAWIYPKSEGENDRAVIISKRDGGGGENDWSFNLAAGATNALTFDKGFDDPGIVYRVGADNDVTLNQWQHVAVTWNGSGNDQGIHLYVNGAETAYQDGNNVTGSPGDDSSRNLVIGNQMNNVNTWDGSIDDVMLFNRTLSSGEIASLYANQSTRYLERNFTSLAEGNYDFKAYTQDRAGNVNSTEARTVSVVSSRLVVTLELPVDATHVIQNTTFAVNSTVTCIGNPCGNVSGRLRYNSSGANPDTDISTTPASPFHIVQSGSNPENCTQNPLGVGEWCNVTWTVNATGDIGDMFKIGTLFESNDSYVPDNHTANNTVKIVSCLIDITLQFESIGFDNVVPNITASAKGNGAMEYNTTIEPATTCDISLYINSTNFKHNESSYEIYAQNLTYNNVSNDFASGFDLTGGWDLLSSSISPNNNATTYFWLTSPPVYWGSYSGNVTIKAVEKGAAP